MLALGGDLVVKEACLRPKQDPADNGRHTEHLPWTVNLGACVVGWD
jgi:hypothetical protein